MRSGFHRMSESERAFRARFRQFVSKCASRASYCDGDGDGFAFLCCLAGFAPGDAAGLGDGAAFGAAIVF